MGHNVPRLCVRAAIPNILALQKNLISQLKYSRCYRLPFINRIINNLNIKTMDLNYLQNEIIPKREQEIKDGKNLATRQPIYVVLDLQENFCSGHSDYEPSTNYRGRGWENGYIDTSLDGEECEFCETDEGMEKPVEVTKFYTDRIIAFFLTSEAAHDYLKYQSHNLSDAYVYVFYSGYANRQMDKLLCNE